ncbi:cytochrome b [Bosea psychrotolerans]|uniref:Cytochrome b561 n=1 Tax=Bosea psychrotolerans TaxID=1871628 RepID=A0A2S4M6W4_9HYPH|nr:cytochrome b [Bosea psychrotolerans]POR50339.1 cytochrome b561 [Bosea psychrotolerans]
MPTRRYDPVTISLHWIIALAVFAAYAIGLVREELPKGDFRAGLLTLHMSIGLLVIALTIMRIGWRAMTPAPKAIAAAPMAAFAARMAHLGLYGAMFAIPLIGLSAAWMKGRVVGLFSLVVIPSPFALDIALAKTLEDAHGVAAHAFMILAGGHALAAIGHHLVLRDATLARMVPFVTPRRSSPGA